MKRTRFKYQLSSQRGTKLTKAESYSLTEADILEEGYSFILISGAYTLTLPAASGNLKGVSILVAGTNASSKVDVAAGFGGGGSAYDTVTIGAYCTVEFWCDGSYWHALGNVSSS